MISLLINRGQLGEASGALERLSRVLSDRWQTMDAIGAY